MSCFVFVLWLLYRIGERGHDAGRGTQSWLIYSGDCSTYIQANDKILDLRDLFYNFHHLINEYRPHQARESLISMMQATLDRTRAETNAIRDAKEKVERVLEGLGSLKVEDESAPAAAAADGSHGSASGGQADKMGSSKKPAWMADSDEMWGGVLEETM